MSTAILKKSLGDAGAAIDESHGAPNILREVLTALADRSPPFLSFAEDPSTGTKATAVVDVAGDYDVVLMLKVGTTGGSGQTDVEAQLNGTVIPGTAVSVANTEADGTFKRGLAESVTLARGDTLTIEVTAADAAQDLGEYSLYLRPVKVEA